MSIVTSIPARDFARHLASAKRAAEQGPVLITDRGRPAYALLRIDDYYRLTGQNATSLLQAMQELAFDGADDFEPPKSVIQSKIPEFDAADDVSA